MFIPPNSHLRKVLNILSRLKVKSAMIYGLSSTMAQTLMMIYVFIIAHWLGVEKYGYIAPVYSATLLTSFIFNWGINEWMIRHGGQNIDPQKLGGDVLKFKAWAGILWAIFLWIIMRNIRPDLFLWDLFVLVILDVWLD